MQIVADREISAALKGVDIVLLEDAVDEGVVSKVICPGPGIRNHTFSIRTSITDPGPIAGTVVIESTNIPTDDGGNENWSPLFEEPIDLSDIAEGTDPGVGQYFLSERMITAIRFRINDAVTGGTVVACSYCGQ